MNGSPRVSLGIITYNQVDFVAEALVAALEQDYDNLEVVVADDCSTDGTADVIREYARRYPARLVPVLGDRRLGITGNSNRCLRACTGKYMAGQGGDDLVLPGKVSRQVEWLEADASRVLCGHDVELFETSTGKAICRWSDQIRMRRGRGADAVLRYLSLYPAMSVMVRASALPAYGHDERLPIVSDWKLWIDCLASGGAFGYIEGVYARYRRHGRNITDLAHDQRLAEALLTLDLVEAEHPHLRQSCRFARARMCCARAASELARGRNDLARASLYEALGRHGRFLTIRTLPLLALAHLPSGLSRPAFAAIKRAMHRSAPFRRALRT